MPRELPDSEVENIVINEPDQTQLFHRRDEFAAGDDASPHIAHTQQAFEIIRLARYCANHGLEREEQPALAQRRLHRRADRRAAVLRFVADLVTLVAHRRPRREFCRRRGAADGPLSQPVPCKFNCISVNWVSARRQKTVWVRCVTSSSVVDPGPESH
jgi:hypothetical protein